MEKLNQELLLNQIKNCLGKFFIIEVDSDGNPQPTVEISEKEFELLNEKIKVIDEFKYFKRKINEIHLNYKDYCIKTEYFKNNISSLKVENVDYQIENTFIDINRVFTNFITSLKTFVEHYEKRIKKKYGKTSNEFKKLKRKLGNYYDSYFSYRLFMLLRNYSIHYGFPINNITYTKKYNTDSKGSILGELRFDLQIDFSRDEIIKFADKNRWEKELIQYNETFPVEPQIIEIKKVLDNLLIGIIEIESEYFLNSAIKILNYNSKSFTKSNTKIGFVQLANDNEFTWNYNDLQPELAELMIKIRKKK